jgi:hypothetical protein
LFDVKAKKILNCFLPKSGSKMMISV